MSKLWGGRFTKETDKLVESYTASINFDKKLVNEDIDGSIAHVTMLATCNIIKEEEKETIVKGLQTIKEKVSKGEAEYLVSHEDIHMNLEKMLIDEVGPVGGKLHTGRSRNDQVATDFHLYVRKETENMIELIENVQQSIIEQAENELGTIMPGYTHLQRAQPVLYS